MKRNIYGVTGYPTPDATTESICRTFQIPNSTLALGAFMGALWPLANPEAWQTYGDMTPDEAAEMMQNILWTVMLGEDVCAIAEAPYWDTAANVDDTLPEGSETWYGQIVPTPSLLASDGLTFLDNLGIWAIAGFIAYAGLPGAALAFVPVAQRFVLAFKQHDLGSIVKVLVDFAEIAEIDTHGVEDVILNLNIVMPDDGMPHTLYVMVDEDNPEGHFAQIVRKELSPSQVTPTTLRWNPDTNTVQQTPDGGTTWVDNPQADPRAGSGFQLPPRTTIDPRCDAAENMVVKLKSMVNIFEAEVAQVQALNALFDIILVFLPDVGIVLQALLAVTEFILTIAADVISAAFTDAQWDIVLCILYCGIADDGSVNQTQFDAILDAMHTQCDTVVYDVLYTIFTLGLGVVGVSNMGATGDAVGDCNSCDCLWCYTFDADTNWDGWTVEPAGIYTGGELVSGVWNSTLASDGTGTTQVLGIQVDIPGTVTQIKVFWSAETTANGAGRSIATLPDNTVIQTIPGFAGTNITTWDGTLTDPTIAIRVDSIASGCCNYITKVIMHGTGDNPFGDNNC